MRPDPASWYVLIGDQQTGPLTRVELGVELATGAIASYSLVWKEGMTDWLPGVRVPELESLFRNPPRSPRVAGARRPPRQEKGAGSNDFDTAHFRLADLAPEENGLSWQMEFDTAHFRLQDLKGSQGARALVPRRIVPRGMEPPGASTPIPSPGRAAPRSTLKPASTAAVKPAISTPVAARQIPSPPVPTPLSTSRPTPRNTKLLPPVALPPPEQSWASLAIAISGALVLASSLLWYAISVD